MAPNGGGRESATENTFRADGLGVGSLAEWADMGRMRFVWSPRRRRRQKEETGRTGRTLWIGWLAGSCPFFLSSSNVDFGRRKVTNKSRRKGERIYQFEKDKKSANLLLTTFASREENATIRGFDARYTCHTTLRGKRTQKASEKGPLIFIFATW